MADTIEEANSLIAKLQSDAATNLSNFNSLNTSHATLIEQNETVKNTLATSQAEVKSLKEVSGGSVKTIEELQKQVTDRDTIIATHSEELKGYEELKTTHGGIVEAQAAAQKERLKLAGLTDEQLEGKNSEALNAMEIAVGVVKPGGTVNGSQNGLTRTGSGESSNGPLDALEASKQAVAKAKERKPATT